MLLVLCFGGFYMVTGQETEAAAQSALQVRCRWAANATVSGTLTASSCLFTQGDPAVAIYSTPTPTLAVDNTTCLG